jgi:uncharacterized membrane protein YfcA
MDSITFLVFLIGLFSAYFGSFASGGVSVLGVGLLTLLGIPPQMATITFKLGKIGDVLGGLYLFHKSGNIKTRYFLWWGIASIVGSFLGTYLIFSIPDGVIYFVSAITMIVLAIVSVMKKVGIQPQSKVSPMRERVYYACLFLLTFVGNLFIAGSGVWYYFVNTFVIKLSSLEAKGQATAMSVFWFIGTLLAILIQWQYVLSWAIALGIGMLIGGYFGTKHIIKIGNQALRNILLGTIVIFAIYFLYLAFHV